MAGKFLTLEEAARLLGLSVEEVNRLVDRKKLFPMRDGAGFKFKADDVERLAGTLGEESSQDDGLSLELDGPSPSGPAGAGQAAADDELAIGDAVDDADWVLGGTSGVESASQTIVRAGANPPSAGPASQVSLAGGRDESEDDLALESLIGASSPSLPRSGSGTDDGTLQIDLSTEAVGGSGPQEGSRATGSLLAGPGAALSGPLDSGLSLEDVELAVSGIQAAGGDALGGSIAASGASLAGEAFELGGDLGDDESASVVIATEESGESSFFGAAMDDSASVAFEEPSSSLGSSSVITAPGLEFTVDTTFSAWQIVGLASCSLLLLTGAFVMLDLVWTIRSPRETALTAPLLEALSKTFSW